MRKLHAHFCTENKGFFPAGTSNMRIKRHLAFQRDNSMFRITPDLEHRSTFLRLKPLRIVCYAARIPSRPQADRLCGSQAKAFELRRFRYSSIARAENSKSSFLPKFE